MNIIKQTANELVLQEKPYPPILYKMPLFFAICFSFPIIFSILFLVFFGKFTLECNQIEPTQIRCEYTEYLLFGVLKQSTQTIKQTQEAKLDSETVTDSDGNITNRYSVTLVGADKQFTILHKSSNPKKASLLASEVNSYINSTSPSLIIQMNSSDVELLMFPLLAIPFTGYIFFVIREISFSAFSIKTLVFNKRATELIDQQEILFGTRTKSYKLNEIVLEEKEGIDDDGSRYYEPTLVLPSGKTHRLLYTCQQEKAILMIQQIKKFLPHVNS